MKEDKDFEHNDDEEFEYTLLREICKSEKYRTFRKHHTEEIRRNIEESGGRFSLSDDLTATLILDITEIIKSVGYSIVKDSK